MTKDARVLREAFVSNDVVYRDAGVNALSQVLADGESADPVLVTGPFGAVKTTIAKFVVGQLRESSLTWSPFTLTVVCRTLDLRRSTASMRNLGKTVDTYRQSTPHDELLDQFAQYDGPPVVVTVDEAGQLDGAHLVYDLYRLKAFSFHVITNREKDLLVDFDQCSHAPLRRNDPP